MSSDREPEAEQPKGAFTRTMKAVEEPMKAVEHQNTLADAAGHAADAIKAIRGQPSEESKDQTGVVGKAMSALNTVGGFASLGGATSAGGTACACACMCCGVALGPILAAGAAGAVAGVGAYKAWQWWRTPAKA